MLGIRGVESNGLGRLLCSVGKMLVRIILSVAGGRIMNGLRR